jgi:hypothetical protein
MPALRRAVGRVGGAVAAYSNAHRKAKTAEELYCSLSRLSDAELAARGLDRQRLTQFLADRLG